MSLLRLVTSAYSFTDVSANSSDDLNRAGIEIQANVTSDQSARHSLFDHTSAPAYDESDHHQNPESKTMTDLTRQEVDAKLAQNKAEVDARLANFDTSIKTGFAELRAEMSKQSGDLRTEMANVRAEMHKNTIDVIKWVIVTVLGVATATVSILTFVINNAAPKAPQQPAAQPAPIIITVPSGAPAGPPAAKR